MELGRMSNDPVEMESKIRVRDDYNSYSYDPKASKWELKELFYAKKWEQGCVVDNVLYYYDVDKNKLRAYDPKKRWWTVVNGVEELLSKTNGSWDTYTVSYDEKLALFLQDRKIFGVWRLLWKHATKRRFGVKCNGLMMGLFGLVL
ncbi:unnamed protein product [Eruca vesicaria subsp. sativa]|uniref:FKB95-like N-terminal Kelch domain-containing protein n=1 Tax=Eruca vesicaria subsp. sativa TaxID=29727 RepID=A0ABC8LX81_ERUVS|nr:unnamed protein product [Eruca vesicaria subsp. sativa]